MSGCRYDISSEEYRGHKCGLSNGPCICSPNPPDCNQCMQKIGYKGQNIYNERRNSNGYYI